MAEKSKKPAIRFAGFTEAWEQRKLSGLANETNGGGTPKTSVDSYWNGNIPWIQSSDIKENEVLAVDIKKTISQEAISNSATKLIPKNSIAIVTRVGVGKLAIIPFSYTTSQDFLSLSGLKTDLVFTAYLLYKKMQSDLNSVQGTAIKGITKEELLNKNILLPELAEQDLIGKYFQQLDNLITLHQRKYDKLVNVKKAMLEKMFPKDGADVPEIRFKGFTEAWEQRKFFDCIERIIDFRGRTPKKLGMDWSESGYLALSAINVKDGYIDLTQDVHYGNQELYDKWMIGNELHKGQVLFTTEAPMGNVAQVPDNRQYILSQRTIAFNVRQGKIAENFLATILRSPSVSFALTSLASGGTAKGVSQSSLSKLDIIIPKNIDEQDSISNIFLELTNLITLHQRKLEKLKNLKKACLEKMFV